jgi:uncharacterized membrane protein (UPF0127 family)
MVIATMILLISCTKAPAVPAAETAAPAVTGPRVILPDGFVVSVEIANDDELRARGLMFRDHLNPGTGMLFFFAQDGHYPFWMKNCRIALDIIWIDSKRTIAHVKHKVPPCEVENCPSYPPNVQARYVLELGAGEAQKHGLKAGDVLRFEETENVVVR